MKFNLTIKNNETGETVRNVDCDGIVGTIATESDKTAVICLTNCRITQLIGLFKGARCAAEKSIEDYPDIKRLVALEELMSIIDKTSEKEGEINDK